MSHDAALQLISELFKLALLLCAPLLAVILVVGLVVSILQVVTQVQDPSIAFVPKLIASLVAAIGAGDADNACVAAHSLRSSSANVGALGLARLCATIEALVDERRFDDAQRHVEQLQREHARVGGAIDALRLAQPAAP